MSDLPYVPFYPSDFFAAAMFLPPRQRPLYAYLLLIQADHGKIAMEPTQIAEHLDAPIGDVQSVLDAKFYRDNDLGGWVNGRMRAEREKALQVIENKRNGAAKARERKKKVLPNPPKKKEGKEPNPDPDPEPESTLISETDIKIDINKGRKWSPDPVQLRLNSLFGRRSTTRWDEKMLRAYKNQEFHEEDLILVEQYYNADLPEDRDHRRHSLPVLLNNWSGEVDRARRWKKNSFGSSINGQPQKKTNWKTC